MLKRLTLLLFYFILILSRMYFLINKSHSTISYTSGIGDVLGHYYARLIYFRTKKCIITCWHADKNALNFYDGFHCLQYLCCTNNSIFTSFIDFKLVLVVRASTYTKNNAKINMLLVQIHCVNITPLWRNYTIINIETIYFLILSINVTKWLKRQQYINYIWN